MSLVGLDDLRTKQFAAGSVERVTVAFAGSAAGAPAGFPLIVVTGRRPGPTAALTAGIHGDEYEGPSALWRLVDTLDPERVTGRILIVPMAHLASFTAGTRTSPVDGQNLARVFPGDASGTQTLRLAHALFEGIVSQADFLVDFHSGGVRLCFLEVCGFYVAGEGIGSEAAAQSLALARAFGAAHLWRLPPRAGVLSFEAMRRGVPAIGLESGGRGGCVEADVAGYLAGVRRVLAARGMIEPEPERPPDQAGFLEGDWALAPLGGFIENRVVLGARVAAGDTLATIRTPLGETAATLTAQNAGLVMGVRHLRVIEAGEWATCVVEERAF